MGALLFAKALHSFQAAVLLVSRGMSAESEAASRTALESAIRLAAIAKDPLYVQKMTAAHERHRATQARALLKLDPGIKVDAQLRAALEETARLEGGGDKLEQTAESVGLGTLYHTVYRAISGYAAHATLGAVERFLREDEPGRVQLVVGIIPEEMPRALTFAIQIMLACLQPLSQIYNLPALKRDVDALEEKWQRILVTHPIVDVEWKEENAAGPE
jgi:hypothetical protein